MDDWIDDVAAELGVDRLWPDETSRLLAAARDVAHGVERKATPLAAFLAGVAVERGTADGRPRGDALNQVLARIDELIPRIEP